MSGAPIINLVMLKMNGYLGPSFFDDTVMSVDYVLRMAGYRTRISTNTVAVDALNIIWGAGTHLGRDLEAIRAVAQPANSVVFNMEQIGSDSVLVNARYLEFLQAYRVLDYNINNIRALASAQPGLPCLEFPLIPAPALAVGAPGALLDGEGPCDVAFYGASKPRREAILAELAQRGLSVRRISGKFGPALSQALLQAKVVLNVHCYGSAIFEMARVLRPLALGVPVVSETSLMPASVDWSRSGIVFSDYQDLVEHCVALVREPERRHMAARRSLALMGDDSLWRPHVQSAMQTLLA